jgi:hypothetical protein
MTSLCGHKRREFPQKVRKAAFIRCCKGGSVPGIPQCETCDGVLGPGDIFYEHMDPDGLGGEPTLENCKVHCKTCKKAKDKIDNPRMAKADRVLKATYGLKPSRQKIANRGFAKSEGQKRASSPVNKWRGYER